MTTNDVALLLAQTTPWWTEQQSGLIWGLAGGGLGTLGGLTGAALGVLAPRGRCRRPVLTAFFAFVVLGSIVLVAGAVAMVLGQPYAVYYPLLLVGTVLTMAFGMMWPMPLMTYRLADRRRQAFGDQPLASIPGNAHAALYQEVAEAFWGEASWVPRACTAAGWAVALIGLMGVGAGLAALADQAGLRVWLPPLLCGTLLLAGGVSMLLTPRLMRHQVRALQASREQQRLAAGEFRRA